MDQPALSTVEDFRRLIDLAPDALVATTADGRILLVNARTEQMFGYTRDDLLGRPVELLVPTALHERHVRERTAFVQGARTWPMGSGLELVGRRKDGSEFPVEISLAPLETAAGVVITAAVRDITERRQVAEALKESREWLNAIFQASRDGIIVEEDERIVYANYAFAHLYGYDDPAELLGVHLSAVQATESNAWMLDLGRRRLAGEQVPWLYEFKGRRKDGSLIELEASVSLSKSGGKTRIITVVRDIAERKRSEDERARLLEEQAARREAEAARQRWAFLAEASAILSSSLDYETTLSSLVQLSVPALADWCSVDVVREDGEIHGLAIAHRDPAKRPWAEELLRRYPSTMADPYGVADVIRTGQSQVFADIPESVLRAAARDERHLEVLQQVGFRSAMIVPLMGRGRTLGAISLVSTDPTRRFGASDRVFAEELASRAALAVDNAKLYEEAQETERHQAFLSELSRVLASSLDVETTARTVARLVLPELGDFCLIHVEQDGQLRQLARAHGDLAQEPTLDELGIRHRPDPGSAASAIGQAWRRGTVITVSSPLTDVVASISDDPRVVDLLARLRPHTICCVPLRARGRALGVITLALSQPGRVYSTLDRQLAEETAHRAAVALDNARLYCEAQEASRMKDEFLATLSHELRTPLNAMLGWARLLGGGGLDAETSAKAIDSIERNTQAQAQLVSDILDLSRIITGKLRLNLRPLELATIVDAALDAVHAPAAAKGVTVRAILDGAPRLAADPDRLLQVVWNLLSNAVKFTPRGGRVEVQAGERDGQIDIRLQDTGIGITPEFLPFVFDRFRQADASTTRVHGGLGLGLAIVRHLVELHGGTVTAESEGQDRGARFIVRLPVADVRPDQPDAAPGLAKKDGEGQRRVRQSLEDVRVLVVDDEADSRELVKVALQQYGASVATAASVPEAMTVFPAFAPQAIVADIGMPGEDGYSLIRRIRALPPERGGAVPAVALTAYALREDRERALEAGFSVHMAKPVEPAELAWTLVSLTRNARA
jgi:PAS domain S-box-containing protein